VSRRRKQKENDNYAPFKNNNGIIQLNNKIIQEAQLLQK